VGKKLIWGNNNNNNNNIYYYYYYYYYISYNNPIPSHPIPPQYPNISIYSPLPVGSMEVNSVSNWEVSREPATPGDQGGIMLPLDSRSQFMSRKKGWVFKSSASPGPEPRRSFGSRISRRESKSLAFCIYSGAYVSDKGIYKSIRKVKGIVMVSPAYY
jgi:hypothetical protein